MKILFDHPNPFLLAHGGFQIQIEQTKAALECIGVEVEFVRWWDDQQKGDLIHFFGIAGSAYLQQARAKALPVAMTTLFTATCNRSEAHLNMQGQLTRLILRLPFGEGIKQQLSWRAFNLCAKNIVGLDAERRVLEKVYRISPAKISTVPLGLSPAYLNAGFGERTEKHLICTGTITQRKNCIQLARMAHAAQTPILFVGKPYDPRDPYWLSFKELIDDQWVKYHPHISTEVEMIRLLKAARGFVLMSDAENWCLSAHEAAACGIPVLLQDQNWSRERFGHHAKYFDRIGECQQNVEILRRFYAEAPILMPPGIPLFSWTEVARQLKANYEALLKTS